MTVGGRIRRSSRTTPTDEVQTQNFHVTHPFHPLAGRQFAVERLCRYGAEHRVCFHGEKDRICEIPLSWTSLALEDPFLIQAAGKSWFRFEDLLELARLIRRCRDDV